MWIDEKVGLIETNIQTGETRLTTGCFYPIMARLYTYVIQASNRPAAAVETARNEIAICKDSIVQGFQNLAAIGIANANIPMMITAKKDPDS